MQTCMPDVNTIVGAALSGQFSSADVHGFESLGSTSEWLRSQHNMIERLLAQGRPQLCVTDWQQAGVGRRGNAWQTLPGNITMSICARLYKPPQALLGLSLVTGIAVAQVLEEHLQLPVMLKWPNDVILNDRKLGGLLTEIIQPTLPMKGQEISGGLQEGKPASDVLTGIGINVRRDENVTSLGIGATSISDAGSKLSNSDRDKLVGAIADKVLAMHGKFVADGWELFTEEWAARDWLADQPVSIVRDNSTERTVARGVNTHGALLVERAGELIPLYSGNVSIRTVL